MSMAIGLVELATATGAKRVLGVRLRNRRWTEPLNGPQTSFTTPSRCDTDDEHKDRPFRMQNATLECYIRVHSTARGIDLCREVSFTRSGNVKKRRRKWSELSVG